MSRTAATPDRALAILRAYPTVGDPISVERWGQGLIHDTFGVLSTRGEFVLQRVHPVFSPLVHHNIFAVTEHLRAKGVPSPELLRSDRGEPWFEAEGEVWRVMTRMRGRTFDTMGDEAQADAAGWALGRFHGALADLGHGFVGMRHGVHDTPGHLRALQAALEQHRDHALHGPVEQLARRVFERASELPSCEDLPARIVHGDPKLNNLLFEASDAPSTWTPVGWVDLDTVGPMALHLELGDAWRSWCNPRGEDQTVAQFRLDLFAASWRGYVRAQPFALAQGELRSLLHGVEWITLELCTRFAADALRESYFGWDPTRFGSRGEHNLVRAQGQWALHEAALACREARASVLGTGD